LYVQASGGQTFPVLRKFLVYSDGNGAYESTLSAALNEVFGVKGAPPPATSGSETTTGTGTPTANSAALRAAIAAALRDEADAEAALKRGDFAAYGRAQAALKRDLDKINSESG
ncbi:MAG TPA: hypothetical protein VHE57_03545, partial [Mycobacteriales bacterium]|nr:hypothetical protein [Mycobacteriales bacterium]